MNTPQPPTTPVRKSLLVATAVAALLLTACGSAQATPQTTGTGTGTGTTHSTPNPADTTSAPETSASASPRLVTSSRATNTKFKGKTTKLLRKLDVQTETGRDTYDRDLYKHWIDHDRDGCDTRREVGIAEAKHDPTVGPDCSFTSGKWKSYYDGVTTTDFGTFDVDHMTPLAEAHDSGGWAWDPDTREAYANDLDDKRSLVAVSASSNRSKGDKDPAEWMPAKGKCRYVTEWLAVKWRWSLTIDPTEKKTLRKHVKKCGPKKVTVRSAPITYATDPTQPTTPDEPGEPGEPGALAITTIVFDPKAAGTSDDPTAETLTLAAGEDPVNLHGWTLHDAAGGTYQFPSITLGAHDEITVHSNTGTDTATDLYAARGSWWNNSGDTATLTDPTGQTTTCAYSGNTTGIHHC